MKFTLALNAAIKFLCGLILVGVLLFVPAGSFSYYNAWLFIALLFVPMLFLGIYLLVREPDLLKKRLDTKEKLRTQKGVVALSGVLFVVGFVLAGLDYRFGWSEFPFIVVGIGAVLLLLSYGLYFEVMRENAYLSRTITVQAGQKVVDTGLYGFIRHPMYLVTLILFLSFSMVLGSLPTLICFVCFIPVFFLRILDEERLLSKDLLGYDAYQKKVKYRLIPFIW